MDALRALSANLGPGVTIAGFVLWAVVHFAGKHDRDLRVTVRSRRRK